MKSRKSRLKAPSVLFIVLVSGLGQLGCSRPSSPSVAELPSREVPSSEAVFTDEHPAARAMRADPTPDDDLSGTTAYTMQPGVEGLLLSDGPVPQVNVGGSTIGFVGAKLVGRTERPRSTEMTHSRQRPESAGLVAAVRLGLLAWLWRLTLFFLNVGIIHTT